MIFKGKNRKKHLVILHILIFILIGTILIANVWKDSLDYSEEKAIQFALAAETGFQSSTIAKLNGDIRDINRIEYKEIKNSLLNLTKQNNEVRFAYIYIQRNNKIYFLADSEPFDSEEYSPPGQEYFEANYEMFLPYENGQTLLTQPDTDRWGTWISVLVPMRDIETGKIIAVFGIDYPEETWYNYAIVETLRAGIAYLCLFLFIMAFYFVILKNKELKEEKIKLYESERSKSVYFDNLPGMAYRCKNDRDWTMLDASKGCFELTGYMAESLLNSNELSFNDIIVPKYREILSNEWIRVLKLREQFKYEYEITTASGQRKWVHEVGQGIFDKDGNVKELEGIIFDITETKQHLIQIQYINGHDTMTGLYNRTYFEDAKLKMEKEDYLPLAIIVGDINGVRIINDAFGLAEGDKIITETAKIIKSCCREKDLLARIGGDEFSILMPNTEKNEVREIMDKIEITCEGHNKSIADKAKCINLSLGYAIKRTKFEYIEDVISEAEEHMNKRKLLKRSSYHSSILTSIMATMYERSQETEEHAKRLAEISKMIGEKLNLDQKDTDELELLAMLHDIGKVGIDDSILNKPGKLNENEWEIMKKHPEIGYRIAMSTTELQPIAEYILTHHERWDGNGYPKGLSGLEIPLLSRILAVVDTYDAITEDRVYRKGMSKEFALEEIRNNSGTQFDPSIVEIFMNIV